MPSSGRFRPGSLEITRALAFFVLDRLQTAGVLSWSRLITRECICLPRSILAPLVVRYRQLWLSKPLGHGWISNRPRPRYLLTYLPTQLTTTSPSSSHSFTTLISQPLPPPKK